MTYAELAKEIATVAHKDQKRKMGNLPYIVHPEAVAKAVAPLGEEYVATAWLHDVLEDTDYDQTIGIDWCKFPSVVQKAVKLLTKRNDVSYADYIVNIYTSGCEVAIQVKIADIRHNLSTWGRTGSMVDKWRLALYILTGVTK